MVVEAVSALDTATLDMSLLGIKKVQGGGLRDSFLVSGVAFKKTFSYAGFEMQPKSYHNPKILLLNIELELKSEKDNAEVGHNPHDNICQHPKHEGQQRHAVGMAPHFKAQLATDTPCPACTQCLSFMDCLA